MYSPTFIMRLLEDNTGLITWVHYKLQTQLVYSKQSE